MNSLMLLETITQLIKCKSYQLNYDQETLN